MIILLNHSRICYTLSPFPHFVSKILSQLFNHSKISIYISLTVQILFTTEPSHSCLRLLFLSRVTYFLEVDNRLIFVSFLCAFFILLLPSALLYTSQHRFPNGKIIYRFMSSPMSPPQDFNPRRRHPLVMWLMLFHLHKSLQGPLCPLGISCFLNHTSCFYIIPFFC